LHSEARDATTEPSAAAEHHFNPSERAGRDWPYSAVKLVDDLAGASPASASFPVGTVVISDDGAGDQTVGSSEVNVLVGWMRIWSAPTGGQAKQQVAAQANRSQASKTISLTRIGV